MLWYEMLEIGFNENEKKRHGYDNYFQSDGMRHDNNSKKIILNHSLNYGCYQTMIKIHLRKIEYGE